MQEKVFRNIRKISEVGKEKMKRQFKYCNKTFRKKKLKAINRVEHKENRVLIQVITKEEV